LPIACPKHKMTEHVNHYDAGKLKGGKLWDLVSYEPAYNRIKKRDIYHVTPDQHKSKMLIRNIPGRKHEFFLYVVGKQVNPPECHETSHLSSYWTELIKLSFQKCQNHHEKTNQRRLIEKHF
jgi:hypothetical protein